MKNLLLIRTITTFLGWVVAFAIVYTIFFLFGNELESLPMPVVALIISGILVTIMGNFVMPFLMNVIHNYMKEKRKEVKYDEIK